MNSQIPSARLRPFRPTPFGRYMLLAELAKGGMGEIYLARLDGPQGFEKLCVIKKILSHLTEERDFVERFVSEAKTLVKLSHGSIAQVLDMGVHAGEPYLALEHVDGKDLRKVAARMRDRQMPAPLTVVLYVMCRVLDALAYAHRKRDEDDREIGLVHRDISPQNILVSYEGEVKVIDFGLAKSTLSNAKTNPSIILGKFLYMSPEQARHTGVDRRSDLYSVGLCLYELIHGKNPFDDAPPGELMASVANPAIPPLSQVEPLCPPSVAQVVMKALAVDPAQRFQTAEEFRGRLLACLMDIDPSAGPESLTRFMRDAFSAEYQTERRMLASLRETARGGNTPPAGTRSATAITSIGDLGPRPTPPARPEVTPVLTRARSGPVNARRGDEGVTEAELPLIRPLSASELTAVSPASSDETQPRAAFPELQPRVRPPDADTDPRAVIADRSETQPRAPLPDWDTQPRAPLPPAAPGRNREDTQPRAEPPEPRVVVGTLLPTPPAGDAAASAAARKPLLPAPLTRLEAPPPSPSAALAQTQELVALVPPPAAVAPPRGGASIWRWVALVVVVTFSAVAYFLHDMLRSGAFLAAAPQSTSRPSDLAPVPVAPVAGPPQPAKPAVVEVVPPPEKADDDEAELEPLTAAPKRPTRRRAVRVTPLVGEWNRAKAAFVALERTRPCELSSMKLLCSRYALLAQDIEEAAAAGVEQDPKLSQRIRAFRAMVDQRSPGR